MLGDFNELGFGLNGVFDSVIWMTTKCVGFLVVCLVALDGFIGQWTTRITMEAKGQP
jgi:hypothetical protein